MTHRCYIASLCAPSNMPAMLPVRISATPQQAFKPDNTTPAPPTPHPCVAALPERRPPAKTLCTAEAPRFSPRCTYRENNVGLAACTSGLHTPAPRACSSAAAPQARPHSTRSLSPAWRSLTHSVSKKRALARSYQTVAGLAGRPWPRPQLAARRLFVYPCIHKACLTTQICAWWVLVGRTKEPPGHVQEPTGHQGQSEYDQGKQVDWCSS